MGLQRISGTFLEPQGQLRSELLPPGCEERVDLIDAARPMDPTAHITRCCTLMSLMRAGVPDHPSEDNLHSLGTRGDGQLCRVHPGGCVADATHPLGRQQGRDEGSRGGMPQPLPRGVTWLTAEKTQTDAL